MKTIFFEKRCGVNIEQFSTIHEVDKFLEEKLGKRFEDIELWDPNSNLISDAGNIFRIRDTDVDEELDDILQY